MTDSFRFAYLHEPPFCFTRPDGAAGGCDVELIEKVAEYDGIKPVGAEAFAGNEKPEVIKQQLWDPLEEDGFTNRSLLTLENLNVLEKYGCPRA